MENRDVVSTLNHLIETCRNGEEGFRAAAEQVDDARLRTLFEQYSTQRGHFAEELEDRVREMGGEPEEGGTLPGAVHRGWLTLRSMASRGDEHGVLAEAERGEDTAKRSYQAALEEDLPVHIFNVIEEQYAEVQETHDRIRSLRDQTESE